jgi:hypothetical protein
VADDELRAMDGSVDRLALLLRERLAGDANRGIT